MRFGTRGAAARWHDPQRRRSRGATAVEYALGLALMIGGSLGAIEALEGDAGDHLEERGAVLGAPDLPDVGVTTSTIATSTTASSTTSTTAVPPVPASASIVTQNAGGHPNKKTWSPTVTISVINSSTNTPLGNALITVRWTKTPGGEVVEQTFTTGSNGRGTFQLNDLEARAAEPGYVSQVLFEVVSITGTNPTIEYTPGTPLTTTLDDPSVGN